MVQINVTDKYRLPVRFFFGEDDAMQIDDEANRLPTPPHLLQPTDQIGVGFA